MTTLELKWKQKIVELEKERDSWKAKAEGIYEEYMKLYEIFRTNNYVIAKDTTIPEER